MRRFAPVIGIVIAGIAAAIALVYVQSRAQQVGTASQPPARLPETLNASASGWEWSYSAAGRPMIEVRAKDFKHVRDPSVFDLEGVELRIFHQEGQKFDRVVSPKARFSLGEGTLKSDTDVEITMGLTEGDAPAGRLIGIQSSGVTFENKTGRAETDQHATFSLDVGQGEADGATYDPQTRELHLKRNVKLIWRGHDSSSPPMYIEAGELVYKEADEKIYLMPWSKFSRQNLVMTGGSAEIRLENGNIRLVSAGEASGVDTQETRQVEFAADQLEMIFADGGVVQKITGQTNARLRSTSKTAKTTVTSDRLDMSFAGSNGGATLRQAVASGKGVAESVPVAAPGAPRPETRLLKAEVIEMKMREGGEEIEQIDTHAHGTLEFLPNRPGQRRRLMEGERMSIEYGAGNQLQSFRSVQVATTTEPDPAVKGSLRQRTWSQDLKADFDPKSGSLSRLEQWGKFRYEEGERQAKSERAVMDSSKNVITLTGAARVWDPGGSTDAERIEMDQKSGATQASGQVKTVRVPEEKGENTIRAAGDRMTTSDGNRKIRYEGQARVWQGENRVEGAEIEIDRTAQLLLAKGAVSHTMKDGKSAGATVVKADSMRYSDREKAAFYKGNVVLNRTGLVVRSDSLRAYLDSGRTEETSATLPDSGLDRAFAEGNVEIVQQDGRRQRAGVGSVADYYVTDNRVVLDGAPAQLTDSLPGLRPTVTRGRKLTWFGNADKLLVDGADSQPAVSSLRRKK